MGETFVEKVKYKKFKNCIRIFNNNIEIIASSDFGPRIIRFGFIDGENEFCEHSPAKEKVGEEEWKMIGGHRLWHSPEEFPRTYQPDNESVEIINIKNGIKMIQKTEPWVQIQKQIEIRLIPDENKVKVTHILINKNAWPVKLAAWGLSVMAPGGMEVIPLCSRDTGMFKCNRNISLWKYSKINDPRVTFGEKYILLEHKKDIQKPFKLGINNEDGWAAYFNHGNLFIKKFDFDANNPYPDNGCNYESYVIDFMIEMESLSPLVRLNPREEVKHEEIWMLYKDVSKPENDEINIDETLKKYI